MSDGRKLVSFSLKATPWKQFGMPRNEDEIPLWERSDVRSLQNSGTAGTRQTPSNSCGYDAQNTSHSSKGDEQGT